MTQIPAGWYPDPAPAAPETPPLRRYWDGRQWTVHVQPEQQAVPSAPYRGQPYGAKPVATTPDGERLAGWWLRVAAYLVDGLIVLMIAAAVGFPFVRRIGAAYSEFIDQALRAAETGGQAPGQGDLLGEVFLPMLGFLAVKLLVNFVYNVGFLKAFQATPGKLMIGLRVRLRARPGALPWGTVLMRWVAQNAASLVAVVPVLGSVASLYPLLDGLWPLWDDKKQALHDKAAKTNVVVRRG